MITYRFCQVNGESSEVSEVSEAMIKNFHNNVEMLLERMQKVSGQGKHIAMDATVQVCYKLGRIGINGGELWASGGVINRVCFSEVAFEFPFIFLVA